MSRSLPVAAGLIGLVIFGVGCRKSDVNLAPVSGVVTLDGEPMKGVIVVFQPETGPPSSAITDTEGQFELQYNVKFGGALVGKQKVRLQALDNETAAEWAAEMGTEPSPIPSEYLQTFRTVEVTEGSNEFVFDLESGS